MANISFFFEEQDYEPILFSPRTRARAHHLVFIFCFYLHKTHATH